MTTYDQSTQINEVIHRLGFLEGCIETITLYAVWKDGKQFVGVLRKPLDLVLKPYKEEYERLKLKLETLNITNNA